MSSRRSVIFVLLFVFSLAVAPSGLLNRTSADEPAAPGTPLVEQQAEPTATGTAEPLPTVDVREDPTATPTPTPSATAPPSATATGPAAEAAITSTVTPTPATTGTSTATPTATATSQPTAVPVSCSVSPTRTRYGRMVTATCTNFAPGETVRISWSGPLAVTLGTTTANSTGRATFSFVTPETPGGRYVLTLRGLSSQRQTRVAMTVLPYVRSNPTSGVTGTTVRAVLHGYIAGERITAKWFDTAGVSSLNVRSVTADSLGTARITFNAPVTPGGTHRIEWRGSGGSTTSTSFQITARMWLTPTTGSPGGWDTAKVDGFRANETITIKVAVSGGTTTVANGRASASGTASIGYPIPYTWYGQHRVTAQGGAGSVASAFLTISAPPERWVEIDLSSQYMNVWEGNRWINGTYVSTGRPGFDTPTGTFYVNTKYVSQTMSGVLGGEYYYVPDVPWVMYFTNVGHAIHGAYWHNRFGQTMSHGCVNLPTYNTRGWSYDFARWLYYWAPMGMRVVIHY